MLYVLLIPWQQKGKEGRKERKKEGGREGERKKERKKDTNKALYVKDNLCSKMALI